ncbi:MAG: single-stranded-DNA-specific exonuclease RecJ [Candidatus Kerfeldbacteria bacterium CG08_land_8_20_14_0_20_40_16]|uniref:Single-stranded-DNA-specific exonuclease RecJ n=1 Tax=Candidatus Kerfeldbacteria bacterium CG08_land_8_20_14_0_20_40_16 TaxID=2014244 RepID=A0A2H0YZ87_9BACT|nr:MAG: single-stranded-DNA-specific exonuclease RecJ [Candidatus Kerfeldbacteria bacterium CG08_land_8_20_14_0_20_40_16]
MNKEWKVLAKAPLEFKSKFPEIPPVVLQLLYNRKLTEKEEVDEFLNPDYDKHTHDPYLFKDMKKAVKRIWKAIQNKEKVVVHGDYDADGVCGSVILYDTLKTLGAAVDIYLPHREKEGYGMNKQTVEELADQGTNLIITTDCGISNQEEVDLANSHSIDVIITDHHAPPENIPKAYAILNPHQKEETYPYQFLVGAGIAFKLASALIKEAARHSRQSLPQGFEKWLLDLVAISTVTDIAPLKGENRALVKYGMVVLKKTRRPGLKALLSIINPRRGRIDTFTIGYQIGPRINAAGRIDHANLAFELLTAESEPAAKALASRLHLNNQERQKATNSLMQKVKAQLQDFTEEQKLIFAVGQEWPAGIIGLVAGKIADEFYRPVLILTEQNGRVTGSGRSVAEFNIVKALEKTQIYFDRWGGHAQACGFTLKKVELVEKFRFDFEKIVEQELAEKKLTPFIEIEAEVKLGEVDWEFYDYLEKFNPFGEANPKPLFVAYQAQVLDWQKVGENGQHLKLLLEQNGNAKKAIGFNFGAWADCLSIGDLVNIVFEVGVNEWNGNRELEIKIIDIKKSDK